MPHTPAESDDHDDSFVDDEYPSGPIPPLLMLRSFLTVGSSYVLCYIAFFGIALGLGYTLFPDFVAFFELSPEQQLALMETNPERAISRPMFLLMLPLNVIACFIIGILVYRLAPFAPLPHGVFLSILLFISYLQVSIADPPAKKSMTVIYMLLFPLAVFLGAIWVKHREEQTFVDEHDTATDQDDT